MSVRSSKRSGPAHSFVVPATHAFLAAVVVLAGSFVALAVAVSVHPAPNVIDRVGTRFMAAPEDSRKFNLAETVSRFGSMGAVIIAATLLAVVCWLVTKNWRVALLCVAAPGAAGFLEILAKELVRRPAPGSDAAPGVYTFPSGHAAGATALACALAFVACIAVHHIALRRVLVVLACTYAFAVACARVVVEAHFVTDVVGGVILGVVVATGVSIALMTPDSPEVTKARWYSPRHCPDSRSG